MCRGLRSVSGCAGQSADIQAHGVDCTTPFGHVVKDQIALVRVALVRVALVRVALVRLALRRSASVRSASVRSAPTTSIIGAGKLRIPSLTGANAELDELSKNLGLPSESTCPITCQIHRRLFQRDSFATILRNRLVPGSFRS